MFNNNNNNKIQYLHIKIKNNIKIYCKHYMVSNNKQNIFNVFFINKTLKNSSNSRIRVRCQVIHKIFNFIFVTLIIMQADC